MAVKFFKKDMKPKIGYISLGCARNLVDTEVALGILKKAGYEISDDLENCDVGLVNTCCFIDDAKQESVDVIMRLVELKKEEKLKRVIIMGCLAQRFKNELVKELKEVDGFVGTNDFAKIADILEDVINGEKKVELSGRGFIYDENSPRFGLTPRHYRYVKISEGCAHRCSFCVIPKVKGRYRSRTIESVSREVERLLKVEKVSEINLIGQDTTYYGMDIYKKLSLGKLLDRLSGFDQKYWLRLLYAHPRNLTDEVIGQIKEKENICKYIDLPVQHINDRILKKMRRDTTKKEILSLIDKVKDRIPDAAIRTSLIVGFPGETEKEFNELLDFVKETEFQRLGVFVYSREEGTPAYKFLGQVPEKTKQHRLNEVMSLQRSISEKINKGYQGREIEVLIDEIKEEEENIVIARTQGDAPEVDGMVYVKHEGQKPKPGSFVKVKVIDTLEYDLVAEIIK